MRNPILLITAAGAIALVAAVALVPRASPEDPPAPADPPVEARAEPTPDSPPAAVPEEAPPADPTTLPSILAPRRSGRRPPDPAVFVDTSDADLLGDAKKLWRAGDPAGAVVRLKVLLGRALTHDVRVEALMEMGFACRRLGDREHEEEALRDAVALAGLDTWRGVFAYNHLGWTLHFEGKNREVIQITDQVLASPHSNDWLRGRARWLRGRTFVAMGERELARREFARILEEFGETESLKDVCADVRRRLRRLTGE